jgi:hypothetical protein
VLIWVLLYRTALAEVERQYVLVASYGNCHHLRYSFGMAVPTAPTAVHDGLGTLPASLIMAASPFLTYSKVSFRADLPIYAGVKPSSFSKVCSLYHD